MAKAKSDPEQWFHDVPKAKSGQPAIVPEIGVRIECRLIVKSADDWEYVRETLDKCREMGAAEVVEYKLFDRPSPGNQP